MESPDESNEKREEERKEENEVEQVEEKKEEIKEETEEHHNQEAEAESKGEESEVNGEKEEKEEKIEEEKETKPPKKDKKEEEKEKGEEDEVEFVCMCFFNYFLLFQYPFLCLQCFYKKICIFACTWNFPPLIFLICLPFPKPAAIRRSLILRWKPGVRNCASKGISNTKKMNKKISNDLKICGS
jgi:DNA mismatch repair ATPase MutL